MRRVGRHIRSAMARSDALKRWATAVELCDGLNSYSSNCTKICRRAVAYGLAEEQEGTYPARFRALPHWRERVDVPGISTGKKPVAPSRIKELKPTPPQPVPPTFERHVVFQKVPDRLPEKIVNSVWSLAL